MKSISEIRFPIPLPRPTEHLRAMSWIVWLGELIHAAKQLVVAIF